MTELAANHWHAREPTRALILQSSHESLDHGDTSVLTDRAVAVLDAAPLAPSTVVVAVELLAGLLGQLRVLRGQGLTNVVVTSNLGSGSSHSNKNLPLLVLGGRFEHGQHLAFEPNAAPLSNVYLSILHQFGLPDPSFGASTGPLHGWEIG